MLLRPLSLGPSPSLCLSYAHSHTHMHAHAHTPVHALTWLLSCVHFSMFGVETQASQPLKTGGHICPPSLSVLPSNYGETTFDSPTLHFPIPHSSTFLFTPPSSSTPALLPTLSHCLKPSRSKPSKMMLLLLSFWPLLAFIHFLQECLFHFTRHLNSCFFLLSFIWA